MAGTDDDTTPITLISLPTARELVVETLLSPPWAEQLIIKWLYQRRRRVRWQYEMVLGQPAPGRTLEQEAEALWAQPTRVLVDWQESCARRVTVYQKDSGCLKPARYIVVIGIRVAREDIERELAQMPRALLGSVAAGNQPKPSPVSAPSSSSLEASAVQEATPATPKILPDDPEMILSVLGLKGFQQEAIAKVVVEHKLDLPKDFKTADLRDNVRRLQKDKAQARGDKLPNPPSWDACDDFVKALRAWRAKGL